MNITQNIMDTTSTTPTQIPQIQPLIRIKVRIKKEQPVQINAPVDYSTISKNLTSSLPQLVKKQNGIYFTPPSCVCDNLKLLFRNMKNVVNVLEPSCGSGEYITILQTNFPNVKITGIENNETIYSSILNLQNDNVKIYNADYLQYTSDTKYDLIIGNPPYFVMAKKEVDKKYYQYFDGRPNIFILFIIKSLELLNENGILSFILPKNFLNCLYYDKTRKYIYTHFQILHIVDCDPNKYIDTQQETIILIVRKQPKVKNTDFLLHINTYTIFANKTNINSLKQLFVSSTSLSQLSFKVSVGTVVWNQCKDILTDDTSKTMLIYSSNITENELQLKDYANEAKKNFIHKAGVKHPLLVINRGYGVGKYNLNYCLINRNANQEYLVENHLLCVESIIDLPDDILIQKYDKIIESLNDPRTTEFIKHYFGNNAINTTELNHILPIYQYI